MMWKKRLSLLFMVMLTLSMMSFFAGCGQQEAVKESEPASAPVEQAEPCPEVDEEAIVKDAAINYFNLGTNLIPAAEASGKLDAFHVIDIRKPEDYAAGHVPGAQNVPMATMGEAIPNLPTDKPLLVYCYSGQTAGQTIAVLRMAGFEAYSITGGFNNGWMKADPELPLEK